MSNDEFLNSSNNIFFRHNFWDVQFWKFSISQKISKKCYVFELRRDLHLLHKQKIRFLILNDVFSWNENCSFCRLIRFFSNWHRHDHVKKYRGFNYCLYNAIYYFVATFHLYWNLKIFANWYCQNIVLKIQFHFFEIHNVHVNENINF